MFPILHIINNAVIPIGVHTLLSSSLINMQKGNNYQKRISNFYQPYLMKKFSISTILATFLIYYLSIKFGFIYVLYFTVLYFLFYYYIFIHFMIFVGISCELTIWTDRFLVIMYRYQSSLLSLALSLTVKEIPLRLTIKQNSRYKA